MQERAREQGQTLDALTGAVKALAGQVGDLVAALKKSGIEAGGGGQLHGEDGAPGEGSMSVEAAGDHGAARASANTAAEGRGEKGGAAANPNRLGLRAGQVSFGPTIKDGLLPTPSAQEKARARGKAKMAEYVGLDEEELMGLEQERVDGLGAGV
ncbi:unnamed protein product [Linum tenue]|uniref:Uncharacterized protein n=1 Tax=Linum tenue TaxID=586396 RepID=A0AAV0QV62_9ROSI|nr:unnamed protein product [Linum tenue]CAI0549378.1 unnamed protein product [Linum tenue]